MSAQTKRYVGSHNKYEANGMMKCGSAERSSVVGGVLDNLALNVVSQDVAVAK